MPDGAMREVAVRPDVAAIAEFANAVFRHADPAGFVAARSFYDDEKNGPPFQVMAAAVRDAPAVVARVAEAAADAARPVVVCSPVCTFATRAGAAEADLSEGLALTVDCDTVDPGVARPALISFLGPPTVAVASGGLWTDPATGETKDRLHLHWRLDEPTRDPAAHAALKEARRLAALIVGGDPSCAPLVHPIRWPGTVHRKAGPRLARIIALDEGVEIALPEALAALRHAAGAVTGDASMADAGSPHAPSRFGAAADPHNTFKATELAVFERVAAGERVPPDELTMATITVLAVSDAFIANGRWNAETAWAFRFGQPEGEPH